MRNRVLTTILTVVLVAPVFAVQTVTVTRSEGCYSGDGGEFTLALFSDEGWRYNGHGLWYVRDGPSFSVEASEPITIGETYNITLNERAMDGGVGSEGDPLSIGAAWLYSRFRRGHLQCYDYLPGPGRIASAKALQETIWWLEEEIADPGTGNAFRNLVVEKFGTVDAAMADNVLRISVLVLNLYGPGGEPVQDMLVCIPAPTALLLGTLGMGLVGWLRRRRTL